ncbi:hypothetical protein HDV05_007157 [Chytridiales sp. JEL 0842]|nr:hypothetical protein HDV05_007157 [Chytridiales sp. JEL 0842]
MDPDREEKLRLARKKLSKFQKKKVPATESAAPSIPPSGAQSSSSTGATAANVTSPTRAAASGVSALSQSPFVSLLRNSGDQLGNFLGGTTQAVKESLGGVRDSLYASSSSSKGNESVPPSSSEPEATTQAAGLANSTPPPQTAKAALTPLPPPPTTGYNHATKTTNKTSTPANVPNPTLPSIRSPSPASHIPTFPLEPASQTSAQPQRPEEHQNGDSFYAHEFPNGGGYYQSSHTEFGYANPYQQQGLFGESGEGVYIVPHHQQPQEQMAQGVGGSEETYVQQASQSEVGGPFYNAAPVSFGEAQQQQQQGEVYTAAGSFEDPGAIPFTGGDALHHHHHHHQHHQHFENPYAAYPPTFSDAQQWHPQEQQQMSAGYYEHPPQQPGGDEGVYVPAENGLYTMQHHRHYDDSTIPPPIPLPSSSTQGGMQDVDLNPGGAEYYPDAVGPPVGNVKHDDTPAPPSAASDSLDALVMHPMVDGYQDPLPTPTQPPPPPLPPSSTRSKSRSPSKNREPSPFRNSTFESAPVVVLNEETDPFGFGVQEPSSLDPFGFSRAVVGQRVDEELRGRTASGGGAVNVGGGGGGGVEPVPEGLFGGGGGHGQTVYHENFGQQRLEEEPSYQPIVVGGGSQERRRSSGSRPRSSSRPRSGASESLQREQLLLNHKNEQHQHHQQQYQQHADVDDSFNPFATGGPASAGPYGSFDLPSSSQQQVVGSLHESKPEEQVPNDRRRRRSSLGSAHSGSGRRGRSQSPRVVGVSGMQQQQQQEQEQQEEPPIVYTLRSHSPSQAKPPVSPPRRSSLKSASGISPRSPSPHSTHRRSSDLHGSPSSRSPKTLAIVAPGYTLLQPETTSNDVSNTTPPTTASINGIGPPFELHPSANHPYANPHTQTGVFETSPLFEKMMNEREALMAQVNEMEHLVQTTIHARLEAEAGRKRVEVERDMLRNDVDRAKVQLAGVGEVAGAVEEVEALRGMVEKTKRKVEEKEKEVGVRMQEVERREGRLNELEEALERRQDEFERESKRRLEAFEELKVGLEGDRVGLEEGFARLGMKERELELLEEDLRKRQAQLEENQQKWEGFEAERQEIEEDRRELQAEWAELRAKDRDVESRRQSVEEQKVLLNRTRSQLETEQRKTETESLRLSEWQRRLETDTHHFETERAQLLEREAILRARNNDFLASHTAASEEANRLAELKREYQEDVERLEAERAALMQREARLKVSEDEVLERAAQLNEERVKVQAEKVAAESAAVGKAEVESLRISFEAYKEEAERRLQERDGQLKRERESLEADRRALEEDKRGFRESLESERKTVENLRLDLESQKGVLAEKEASLRRVTEDYERRLYNMPDGVTSGQSQQMLHELERLVHELRNENAFLKEKMSSQSPNTNYEMSQQIAELEHSNRQLQNNILKLTEMLDAERNKGESVGPRLTGSGLSSESLPDAVNEKIRALEDRLHAMALEEGKLKEALTTLSRSHADFQRFQSETQPIIKELSSRSRSQSQTISPKRPKSPHGQSSPSSPSAHLVSNSKQWTRQEVDLLQEAALGEILSASDYDKLVSNKAAFDLLNVIVSLTTTNQTLSKKLDEAQSRTAQLPSSPNAANAYARRASQPPSPRMPAKHYAGASSATSIHPPAASSTSSSRFPESYHRPASPDAQRRNPKSTSSSRINREDFFSERDEQHRRGWESAGGDRDRKLSPTRKSRPWSYASSRGYVTDDNEREQARSFEDRIGAGDGYGSKWRGDQQSMGGYRKAQHGDHLMADIDDGNVDSVSDLSEIPPVHNSFLNPARPPLVPRIKTTSGHRSAGTHHRAPSYGRYHTDKNRNDDDDDDDDEKSPSGNELPSSLKLLSTRPGASLYSTASKKTSSHSLAGRGKAGQQSNNEAAAGAGDGADSRFPRSVSIEGLRAYFTDEDLKNFSETTRQILFGDKTSSLQTKTLSPSAGKGGSSGSKSTVASSIRGALSESEGGRKPGLSVPRTQVSKSADTVAAADYGKKNSIRDMIRARVKERDMEHL